MSAASQPRAMTHFDIYIVNHAYGSSFPVGAANDGKNMAFTDWMYGR